MLLMLSIVSPVLLPVLFMLLVGLHRLVVNQGDTLRLLMLQAPRLLNWSIPTGDLASTVTDIVVTSDHVFIANDPIPRQYTRANEAPTNISLSSNTFDENVKNAIIGSFLASDDDGDTHTFTLISGSGDNDNTSFSTDGNQLSFSGAANFEEKSSYAIRIQAQDQLGNTYSKAFTISVNNVIETGNDIITFSINGQTSNALINKKNHTIAINMQPGTDLSALTPTLTISSGASILPLGTQDFSSDVNYTVEAENGTQQVWVVSATDGYEGVYSVKTGGDFETFSSAITSINSHGLVGDVALELDGSFVVGSGFTRYSGTEEHSLTIRPTPDATSVEITNGNGSFGFFGVENATIDGQGIMTILYGSSSGYAIWLDRMYSTYENNKNIAIKNVTVKSPGTGILITSGETVLIDNCRFELNSNPGTYIQGISISGSHAVSNITISNNTVAFDDQITGATVVTGISLEGTQISGTNVVYNNVISLQPDNTSNLSGMTLSPQAMEALDVYHNTISLSVMNGTGSTTMIGILLAAVGSYDASVRQICQNNIIELGDVLSGTKYGIRYTIDDTPLVKSSYNNVSHAGSGGTLYYASINGVNYDDSNLATLQGMIDGFTNSSVIFSDAANEDYSLSGASLSQSSLRGTPIVSVTEDKEGNSRSTTAPSKGAFESANNIAEITSFSFTNQVGESTIDLENQTVTAVIASASDLSAITPTIEIFSGSTISPLSGVEQDFTNSVVYTVTAEDASTQDWTVSITEEVVIWSGTAWSNGSGPTDQINAQIEGDYTGGFESLNLTVDNGATLTITTSVSANGDVVNNGDITVESGASFITFAANTFTGNDITVERNTRYSDGKYSFVGTPVKQDTENTASDLGGHVYTYDEAQSAVTEDLARWIPASGTDELVPGKGYTQANKQLLTFVGEPNTGTITYAGSYTNDGWHMVANPYAAAIFIDDFLDANTNTTGAVYIWDDNDSQTGRGSNDDYIVANKSGATDNNGPDSEARWNGHLGSAQGFFVQLNGSAGDISFTEAMRRTGNNSDGNFFRKTKEEKPLVRLNLSNADGLYKQAIVAWNNEISNENLTSGYDAPMFDTKADDAIYTMKAGEPLTIQTITDQKEEIALGLNVKEAGHYQIDLRAEFTDGRAIYLLDKYLDKTIDLTQEAYSFTTDAVKSADRFSISVKNEVLSTRDETAQVYVSNKSLVINMTSDQPAHFKLYDLTGKHTLSIDARGSTKVNLSHLKEGVYLLFDGRTSHKFILR